MKIRKIDKVLAIIWFVPLPIVLVANLIFIFLLEFSVIDIDFGYDNGILWANTIGLLSAIYLIGFLVNTIINIFKFILRR